jgi:hypothetical protein
MLPHWQTMPHSPSSARCQSAPLGILDLVFTALFSAGLYPKTAFGGKPHLSRPVGIRPSYCGLPSGSSFGRAALALCSSAQRFRGWRSLQHRPLAGCASSARTRLDPASPPGVEHSYPRLLLRTRRPFSLRRILCSLDRDADCRPQPNMDVVEAARRRARPKGAPTQDKGRAHGSINPLKDERVRLARSVAGRHSALELVEHHLNLVFALQCFEPVFKRLWRQNLAGCSTFG